MVRQLEMVELGQDIGVDLVLSGTEDDIEQAMQTLGGVDVVRFASYELGNGDRD